MTDPATGWFKIKEINTKRSYHVSNVVIQAWMTRYPWPTEIFFNRGTEFIKEFTQMDKKDYGITKKVNTKHNPQANTKLKYIPQTIDNILCTFAVQNVTVDKEDPWSGILYATLFDTRDTVHTTNQMKPIQLVFG